MAGNAPRRVTVLVAFVCSIALVGLAYLVPLHPDAAERGAAFAKRADADAALVVVWFSGAGLASSVAGWFFAREHSLGRSLGLTLGLVVTAGLAAWRLVQALPGYVG